MTGKTAERFRIPNRGLLEAGYYADITIFDYENLHVEPQIPDFTPKGIQYVFVNGVAVVDNGNYNPLQKGKMILKK
jgi:N-acyl-D-amino-acid deacylase